jgi:hypothetical protein
MTLPALVLVHGGRTPRTAGTDTCHDLMVSEPIRLAKVLVDRCRLYSR